MLAVLRDWSVTDSWAEGAEGLVCTEDEITGFKGWVVWAIMDEDLTIEEEAKEFELVVDEGESMEEVVRPLVALRVWIVVEVVAVVTEAVTEELGKDTLEPDSSEGPL